MMTSTPGEGFNYMSLIPFVLIFVVMYFLLIRPQQKRARQQQEMLKSIVRGDKVLTSGGIIGTVSKVISDQELEIEISNSVKVHLMRSMIVEVLNRSSLSSKGEESPVDSESKVRKIASKKAKSESNVKK